MLLTNDMFEFSTPLSPDTHGIKEIYLWIFLNMNFIGISKSRQIDNISEIFLLDFNIWETNGIFEDFDIIKATVSENINLIKEYASGTLDASVLVCNFKKASYS